jgi:hypothetical protein
MAEGNVTNLMPFNTNMEIKLPNAFTECGILAVGNAYIHQISLSNGISNGYLVPAIDSETLFSEMH